MPVTLGITHFTLENPFDAARSLMDQCFGAVVLGYSKTSPQEETAHATVWNQIESTLSLVRKVPTLVVKDIGISSGFFDRGSANVFIYEVNLTDSEWPKNLDGPIRHWVDLVKRQERGQGVTDPVSVQVDALPSTLSIADKYDHLTDKGIYLEKTTGKPFCVNCMHQEKEVPLMIQNVGWKCHVCDKFFRDYSKPIQMPKVNMGQGGLRRLY